MSGTSSPPRTASGVERMSDDRDEFHVVVWYGDWYDYALRNVSVEVAVKTAKKITDMIESGDGGEANKVMITDGGDNTNFLWEVGKGIVFPTREELGRK